VKSLVILLSGRGSNFLALLEAQLPGRITAVISNRPEAGGLAYARERGITTVVLDHREFGNRAEFDAALGDEIERHGANPGRGPDLVVLTGFMRILGDAFVDRFERRLLNIHPSLLPSFPGLATHAQALAAGVKVHGCSVHFVTSTLDNGPIVIQAAVPVMASDTEQTLATRVLAQEHRIYPLAVRWFLEGRLSLTDNGRVVLDSEGPPPSSLIAPTG
jgi:phosphoribosylglycinamide formyltransferase-1